MKMKQLLTETNSEVMIPVQGVVKEFVDGVNKMARISTDMNIHKNDIGFNSTHTIAFFGGMGQSGDSQHFNSSSIPLQILVKWINYMKMYQRTQNPFNRSYDDIVSELKVALKPYLPKTDAGNTDSKVVKLTNKPPNYGKYVIYVTDGEKVFPRNRKWIAYLSKWFDDNGVEQELDNYGKYKYPLFKYFTKNRNSIDGTLYDVKSDMFPMLANFFKQYYPEYQVDLKADSQPSLENPKEKLKFSFYKDSANFSFWNSEKGFVFNKLAKDAGIYQQGVTFPMQLDGEWYTRIWHGKEQGIIDLLDKDGTYDTSELKSFIDKQKQSSQSTTGERFRFSLVQKDIYVKPVRWKTQDPKAYDMLKEMVKFSFPIWQTDRTYDKDKYSHVILSKDLNSLTGFYRWLSKQNLKEDAKEFGEVVKQLKAKGLIEQTHIDGILPEYKNDIDRFYREVNDTTKINLYPKQLHGVRHLFSRKTALLGDETGVGKTAQVIAAANLRLQKDGGKCLVITLKSVQPQWAMEIIKFVGATADEISFDGTNPKKWTILYYENFSSGNKKEDIMKTIAKTDFTVVAFDEIHKVKHDTAKRSKNIHEVTKRIPYKWGASATMAANKPFDIKNQLTVLGHRMGDVSPGWFKREFAGMVPEGYGGAYVDGSRKDKIEAAIQFRKWLANSGLYIRRSKHEIRSDMPDLDRNTININLSNSEVGEYEQHISEKLKTYKDPSLAVSKLLAARESVAIQKVPYTIKRALQIIENGEKLVIFTTFKAPGRQLVNDLSQRVKQLNPNYKVGTYTSDSKDRTAEKERFMKDPMVKALVMSIKVGGTGVDFPNGVNHMLVNDFDWTPEQAEQSEGRIFRINSMDNKHVEYIIADNTIDSEVYQLVQDKREISEILQEDLTKAYENPEDEEIASRIYDAMAKMKDLDARLEKAGDKI